MGEEIQKVGKDSYEVAVRSFGQANKGFEATAAEMTEFSKKAFEDDAQTFEQLMV